MRKPGAFGRGRERTLSGRSRRFSTQWATGCDVTRCERPSRCLPRDAGGRFTSDERGDETPGLRLRSRAATVWPSQWVEPSGPGQARRSPRDPHRAATTRPSARPRAIGAAGGSPRRRRSSCGRSTGRTCERATAWDELVANRAEQAGLQVADVPRASLAKLVRLYRLGAKVRAGLRQARRRRRVARVLAR